jgi:hypothetical protein
MEVAGSSEPLVTVCHTCTLKVEVAESQETAMLIVSAVVTSDLTTSLHSEAVKQTMYCAQFCPHMGAARGEEEARNFS